MSGVSAGMYAPSAGEAMVTVGPGSGNRARAQKISNTSAAPAPVSVASISCSEVQPQRNVSRTTTASPARHWSNSPYSLKLAKRTQGDHKAP